MLSYLLAHHMDLLRALVEHVELSAAALFLASLVAFPLGYTLSRSGKASDAALAVLGGLYAIPSMALLALLVPVFGLGYISALIALVLYAQSVLVRSVVLGFRSIDSGITEAAKGMGLSTLQRLIRVEWPLALPILLGGVRLAAASVIAITGLAAWINAGGLGSILFEGIRRNDPAQILVGTLLISGLALLTEFALLEIEKCARLEAQGVEPWQMKTTLSDTNKPHQEVAAL